MNWNIGTKLIEVNKWDSNKQRLVKAKIQVTFTQKNLIIYSSDGVIQRQEQVKEICKNPKVLTNMEQIQYFQWQGKYGQEKRKQGKWTVTWDGQALLEVGGYYKDGLKEGLWTEPNKNYWSKAQVYENGEYFEEQKCGKWKYIYNNNVIGCGLYNEQFKKNGKWIELSDSFSDDSRVIYNGEYKNGKKIGRWDICYTKYSSYPFLYIGGGSYDERGEEIKLGKWVELSEGFFKCSQVTENGEYKNGNKIGRWDIQGHGIKTGDWIEISNGFFEYSQVTYIGEYQNGKKFGGGSYEEGGIKFGIWIEVQDGFKWDSQVTYYGKYINGRKVGRWDIWYKENKQNLKIGGGCYEEGSNEIKLGNWVLLYDGFFSKFQVTYHGEYKDGQKVGRWDIFWNYKGYNTQIGGGSYDDQGDQLKFGSWVELWDRFDCQTQVTYIGEYNNGNKVRKWDIWQKVNEENVKIGGGAYDEKGIKLGNWMEISNGFNRDSEITYDGRYDNGIKVGRWDIWYQDWRKEKNEKIGGGLYSEEGDGIKLGSWIEVSDEFGYYNQIIYIGEYKNGNKVGKWVEMNIRRNQKCREMNYDN
ncbi:unnamed protein product [Paramecium primaurelia]|uniref:Uncharacterized protein n=1 Tax=Paramecium primaurelia TaxID=5886 RepID=A0A8S1KL68_PARPR|nr:unnamed protein product [Paramecium primaurelia]